MSVSKMMRIKVTGADWTDVESLMERLRLELLQRARPQATSLPDLSGAPVLGKAADELTVTLRPDGMHAVLVTVLTEFLRTHADAAIEIGRAAIRSDTPLSHVRYLFERVAATSDLEVEYHLTCYPGHWIEALDPEDRIVFAPWIEVAWSYSDWMPRQTSGLLPWLEPFPLPETDEVARSALPVTIYLSDERIHDQVEAAVDDLLATAGLQVEDRDEPVIGSWFRRMRAALKDAARSPAAREGALVAAHAADTRLVLSA
jgi:hypothetical protein